ncbi:hypothetical protein FOA43_001898 [Brettanomyces nanus]|uniref:Rab-GAP TBC domain-containing protein n=1 Tax=Eeniella nana TaxID=13502 RepID=A0A875RUH1_EENNA|nr:uncharacterized protein FOA43_001898 [Brettanomyces nanus]QPG74567.1 hypothetical protein FOA43_001898 [Brettanomyces nanus]
MANRTADNENESSGESIKGISEKADSPETVNNDILTDIHCEDKKRFRTHCLSNDGLVSTSLRAQAWPILTGCEGNERSLDSVPIQFMAPHRDESQVKKDVDRSYIHYPENMAEETELELKAQLKRLIVRMLREVPDLNYYQGYHDVAAVVTIIFGKDEQTAFNFLYYMTLRYLRDHMLQDIDPTLKQLDLIPEILWYADRKFYNAIKPTLKEPIFALSSIISLFAHDLNRFDEVCLLWDAIIAEKDPSMPLYLYVSMMVRYRAQILQQIREGDGSAEFIHVILSRLINSNINSLSRQAAQSEISAVIKSALKLKRKICPIRKLRRFRSISKYSCLKDRKVSTSTLGLQVKEEAINIAKARKRKQTVARYQRVAKNIQSIPLLLKISIGVGLLTVILALAMDPQSKKTAKTFGNSLLNGWIR